MRIKLLLLSFVLLSSLAYGQQEAQYTNFMFSKMAFNPGYAGIDESICATALHRQQWIGFNGPDGNSVAPQTSYLTVNGLIKPLRSGVGLTVISDQLGFENNTGVKLAVSHHLNIGPGKLGIGLQAGFMNKVIDFTKFNPLEQGDELLQGGGQETSMNFDLAFGAYYKIDRVLYAGISSTQITEAETNFSGKLGNPEYKRHYYIMGGYFYQLPNNPSIELNPNLLVKTDFAAAQYDFNVLAWYNKKIYAGVNYRVQDAASLMAGYAMSGKLSGLRGGISYDITTMALGRSGRSFGSAEVYINYCFDIVVEPKRQSHGNVRFLF